VLGHGLIFLRSFAVDEASFDARAVGRSRAAVLCDARGVVQGEIRCAPKPSVHRLTASPTDGYPGDRQLRIAAPRRSVSRAPGDRRADHWQIWRCLGLANS
jgi:hypothetical protein